MFYPVKRLSVRDVILMLLLVSALGAAASATKIKPRKGMNVVGQVTVDGKPRAGVTVSDGVNVVTTDKKGIYQMASTGRQHVFVSVPSDCRIPMADGMPAFYQTIPHSDGSAVTRRDFELQSAPGRDKWTLFVVADPQIAVPDTADFSCIIMPQMRKFVSTLGENTVGIALGDLVWNSPELYPRYVEEISTLGIPVLSVIGNHDHNQFVKNDTESDRDFRNALGPAYYSVNVGDCHIVALDDILYRGVKTRNDYSARITSQQLDWLRKDLANVDTSKTVIVGLHIPTARRNSPSRLQNSDSLYALLRPFHRAEILSGHTHYNFSSDIEPGITETTFASSMGALWHPLCGDGTPRGFAAMEFTGPEVTDKYFNGAGYPRSYQMEVYAPADAVLWDPEKNPGDSYDKILINIFFWHHDWTVEVSEDGRAWAALGEADRLVPKVNCKRSWDPNVRKCMVNGHIPATHGKPKPTDHNDHMFLYKPSPEWKTVTVRATDPYGNVYTETLMNPEK